MRTLPTTPALPGNGAPAPDSMQTGTVTDDRRFVIALARGLAVLRAFEPGDDLLTNADLAARARLPKATISRFTHTLSRLGYLAPDPAGAGYRLDPHVLTLGFPVLARHGVRELARPLLQALATSEGVAVSIGLRDGAHMIFVERVRSPAHSAMQQDIGTRVPIATTALGRAYLAGMAEPERTALMQELRATGLPGWWGPVRKAIDREIARHRSHGYCLGGDWLAEVNGVAVPLALPGRALLALGCGAPRDRVPEARLNALGERLKSIVQRLALAQETGL